MGVHLDKNNGQPGGHGARTIHLVGPMPKAYFKTLQKMKQQNQDPPQHAFGCVAGRRREEAVAIKLITAFKLKHT
eukprot:7426373-Heterocapsa_arctica.AAC.1